MEMKASREKWSSNFSEWFDWVIREAEVYDYGRYPIKGVGIWLPYGFKIRKFTLDIIRKLLDETGHEEILLPMLIPEHLLRRESEHVKGFEGEVYWVTRGGVNELDVKLALRPTSETAISFMESLWIKSYKQLPKKYYQIVSIFRYETKATRPMIRLREVTTFKEAHTVHDSFEDAERQVLEAMEIYKKFFDTLGIPYIISRRPKWDTFAGALYTIAFDTIMPDGRALQIGTVHLLGQNFTKPFEVIIQRRDEVLDYAWQTSYGISDRVIACIVAIHGDDRGLRLPPVVAPIQVVVVPIPAKDEVKKRKAMEYADAVASELAEAGVRVHVDKREDLTPGYKYYDWELRGVPLRIEVGLKEAEQGFVTIARRDTFEKIKVSREELVDKVKALLDEVQENLKKQAWDVMKSRIYRVKSIEEIRDIVANRKGVAEIPWCGSESCGLKLEELVEGKALGRPMDEDVEVEGVCPICGKKAFTYLRLAKTY